MQINLLPGVRFMETFFWNSTWPAESLKTLKPFDGIFWGFNPISTRLLNKNVVFSSESCAREADGRLFHRHASAAAFLLSPKVLCVRGTAHRVTLCYASIFISCYIDILLQAQQQNTTLVTEALVHAWAVCIRHTRQRSGWESNPGPADFKSSARTAPHYCDCRF